MIDEFANSGLIPLKMCASAVTLDQYQPGWTLAQDGTGDVPEARVFAYYIPFDAPFSNVPLVQVGIAGFDIDNRDTGRLSVRAADISCDGFSVEIRTWLQTRVYMVEVSWFALGSP